MSKEFENVVYLITNTNTKNDSKALEKFHSPFGGHLIFVIIPPRKEGYLLVLCSYLNL
jgi:hypothetical protein